MGLKSINMNRLDKVVLIAGKNGSGKSRLLKLIKGQINDTPGPIEFSQLTQNITASTNGITDQQSHLKNLETALDKPNLEQSQINRLKGEINRLNKNIESYKQALASIKQKIANVNYIVFDPEKAENSFIDFVPVSSAIKDSYTISSRELDTYAKSIYKTGTNSISEGAIPAIEKIQKCWVC